MELLKPIKNMAHLGHCIGELLLWKLQDALIAVDDAIVELPDV